MTPFTDYRLWIVGLGTLIVPLDSSVNVAFPHIADHFAVAPADLRLVVVTFILTNISLLLIFGRTGDLWGYRRMFRLGLAVSAVALLFDALAPSYEWLLAARILQGVGGALTISCGPALVIGLYPEQSRGPAIGAYAMIFALGTAIGPVVGGALIAVWDWSAVFWFRVPLALLALALSLLLPAPQRRADVPRFDLRGAMLLGVSISTVFMAFNLIGDQAGVAVGVAVISLASIWAFIHQQFQSPAPIINLRYFRDWPFSGLIAASVLVNFASFSIMLVVPFYLPRIGGYGVIAVGLLIAAYPVGITIAAPIAGRLLRGEGAGDQRASWLRILGATASGVGLWGVASWGEAPPVWLIVGSIGVIGAGLGLFQAAYLYTVTGTLPPEERGVAGSLAEMTRSMGNLTAATVLFELFRSRAAADGFMAGFNVTYGVAAIVPAIVLSVVILHSLARRRG